MDFNFSNHSAATAKRCTAIKLLIPLSRCYSNGNRYTNHPKPHPATYPHNDHESSHKLLSEHKWGRGAVGLTDQRLPQHQKVSFFLILYVHPLVIVIFCVSDKQIPRNLCSHCYWYTGRNCGTRKCFIFIQKVSSSA